MGVLTAFALPALLAVLLWRLVASCQIDWRITTLILATVIAFYSMEAGSFWRLLRQRLEKELE